LGGSLASLWNGGGGDGGFQGNRRHGSSRSAPTAQQLEMRKLQKTIRQCDTAAHPHVPMKVVCTSLLCFARLLILVLPSFLRSLHRSLAPFLTHLLPSRSLLSCFPPFPRPLPAASLTTLTTLIPVF
jgi:hypothetical protein